MKPDTTTREPTGSKRRDTGSQLDQRVMLALIMVLVATLGAIAAYRTATAEQELAELSRLFAEGQLVGTAERQKLLDGTLAVALLEKDLFSYETAGNSYAERAATLRDRDPRSAAVLDFKAQEEFAAARALAPFAGLTRSALRDNTQFEERLQFELARTLAGMGFPVEWRRRPNLTDAGTVETGASAWESGRIWTFFSARISAQRELVPKLALCVVGFVAALAIFSCADLARTRKRWRFFLSAGLVLAIASLIASAWVDPNALVPFGIALTAAAALFVLACRSASVATPAEHGHPFHPAGLDIHGFAGEHLHGGQAADGFTRFVIGAVAVTALCSALAGYGYSRAEAEATAAASRASADTFEIVTRSSRLGTQINSLMTSLASEAQGRARRSVLAQASGAVERRGNEALLAVDAARVEGIARLGEDDGRVAELFDDKELGQAADPRFPARLVLEAPLRNLSQNAFEPFALWDAERGEVLLHHHVAAAFLGTLTLFAIALYLFGQGLGMGRGRSAYLLIACGVAFVAAAIAWGVRAELVHSTATVVADAATSCRLDNTDHGTLTRRERAARHYALGHAKYSVAVDDLGYADALPDLECAVLLGVDFAAAYRDLAGALELAHSSKLSGGYILTDMERLPRVIAVREQARKTLAKRGFDVPVSLLHSIGVETYQLALAAARPEELPLAERTLLDALAAACKAPTPYAADLVARKAPPVYDADLIVGEALALYDRNAISAIRFNLGVVQLARGEFDKAEKTYAQARSMDACPDNGAPSNAAARGVTARPSDSVLSDATTALEALVGRCKHIADAERCDRIRRVADELKTVIVGGRHASPYSSAAVSVDYSPSTVRLALRFDDFKPDRDKLVVIWSAWDPQWKSWYVLADISGSVERGRIRTLGDGVHHAGWSLLRATRGLTCLPAGRYRAEAYVNGRQVGTSVPFDLSSRELVATRLPRLNLQLCAPAEWKSLPTEDQDDLVEGFRVADGRGGYDAAAFMFTTHLPLSNRGHSAAERNADLHILHGLTDKRLIPENAAVLHYRGSESCIAARPAGSWYWSAFPTTEGVRHLAVVAGDMLPGHELCDVLDSIENRYTPYLQATARH